MTVQVMWKVPAWGLTFQIPQQTVIMRIASQSVFTKCSSFRSSHLIVTAKFPPFWGHLQLDHPVTSENIKCYSHFQILVWIKSYNFLITFFLQPFNHWEWLASYFPFQYHSWIKHQGYGKTGNKLKNLLIVIQILFASTLGNV